MCTFVSVREKVELCVCERGVGGSVWVDVGRCTCTRARVCVCVCHIPLEASFPFVRHCVCTLLSAISGCDLLYNYLNCAKVYSYVQYISFHYH